MKSSTDGTGSAASGGFTLIEVVIAMAIAAMALTLVASGVGIALDNWSAVTTRLDDLDRERYQLQTLRRQLEGALPVRYGGPEELTPMLAFEGTADQVRFVSRTGFGAGPFAPARWVTWSVASSDGLRIEERDMLAPDNAAAAVPVWGGTIPDLDLRFQYLRPVRGQERPVWLDQWQAAAERYFLPTAVRLVGRAGEDPIRVLISLDYAEAGREGLVLQ